MTLEDETGFVNAVIWESVFQRYSILARTVSFLGITGTLQVEDGVVHPIAEKLWEPKLELKPSGAGSRNFH
jgi:error-prone DNA polymerase